MKNNFAEVSARVVDHPNKTSFFFSFMRDLAPEIALSVMAGYLQPDRNDKSDFKGWRGTVEHQIVVALGSIALGEIIGLPKRQIAHLMQNGATHDANQKFERMRIKRHKYEEQIYDSVYLALPDRNLDGIIGLDSQLQSATKPTFLAELESGHTTKLQRCLFYLDDLTRVSSLTQLETRIFEARNRDIQKNGKATNDWDKELTLANSVQEELAESAAKNGYQIDNHRELPTLILLNIMSKFDKPDAYFVENRVSNHRQNRRSSSR